jgi:hypothetical protein
MDCFVARWGSSQWQRRFAKLMSTEAFPGPDIPFLKKRTSCYSTPDVRRLAALPAGRRRRLSTADRSKKFGGRRKLPCPSCKALISHKMDEGTFGNIWRKRPQIWKCLAWAWKGLVGPMSGEGDGA